MDREVYRDRWMERDGGLEGGRERWEYGNQVLEEGGVCVC